MNECNSDQITVVDYGRKEYLDGVLMQFCVWEGPYVGFGGRCLAYFGQREHALQFARSFPHCTVVEYSTG